MSTPDASQILSAEAVRRALSVPDLTDPHGGVAPHALQLLVDEALSALREAWGCAVHVERQSPIVSVADNYDRLHYPRDGAARAARYTRYVCESALLRTQTSAMIPPLLRRLAASPPRDILLACPGVVYRRDCIDRLHSAEPHQMDLWRLSRARRLDVGELHAMVERVISAVLPGRELRTIAAEHPYTRAGLQIDVRDAGSWIEVGECGLALPELLAANGHPAPATGLAMGLGLDRILMLRKGVPDIRLLRSSEPRVSLQMRDLSAYQPVSSMPPVRRDLSLVVADDLTAEELGDAVRDALCERSELIEAIDVLCETPWTELPPAAIERLGIGPGQKNLLVRVVLRALDRTLTHAECNLLRDDIYAALHRGSVCQWASAATQAQ